MLIDVMQKNFTHPVHEEITNLIFGCDAAPEACVDPEIGFTPPSVQAGVRWNDDPPFRLDATGIPECHSDQTIRLVTQPVCWYKLFRHAEKRAASTYFDGNSKRWNTMYRSQFGDLQFVHAMASRDGETAGVTRDRILMWAEFVWSIVLGELKTDTRLINLPTNGFSAFFPRSGQSVSDLFTLGNSSVRRYIPDVAFGSLLHMVEDSFAFANAERLAPEPGALCPNSGEAHPGVIRSFRSYSNQDHKKHGGFDSRESFQQLLLQSPNVIDVGKVIVALYDQKAAWPSVERYLRCVFEVLDETVPATPGDGLSR